MGHTFMCQDGEFYLSKARGGLDNGGLHLLMRTAQLLRVLHPHQVPDHTPRVLDGRLRGKNDAG